MTPIRFHTLAICFAFRKNCQQEYDEYTNNITSITKAWMVNCKDAVLIIYEIELWKRSISYYIYIKHIPFILYINIFHKNKYDDYLYSSQVYYVSHKWQHQKQTNKTKFVIKNTMSPNVISCNDSYMSYCYHGIDHGMSPISLTSITKCHADCNE